MLLFKVSFVLVTISIIQFCQVHSYSFSRMTFSVLSRYNQDIFIKPGTIKVMFSMLILLQNEAIAIVLIYSVLLAPISVRAQTHRAGIRSTSQRSGAPRPSWGVRRPTSSRPSGGTSWLSWRPPLRQPSSTCGSTWDVTVQLISYRHPRLQWHHQYKGKVSL